MVVRIAAARTRIQRRHAPSTRPPIDARSIFLRGMEEGFRDGRAWNPANVSYRESPAVLMGFRDTPEIEQDVRRYRGHLEYAFDARAQLGG